MLKERTSAARSRAPTVKGVLLDLDGDGELSLDAGPFVAGLEILLRPKGDRARQAFADILHVRC